MLLRIVVVIFSIIGMLKLGNSQYLMEFYDSGVFIESGSFESTAVSIDDKAEIPELNFYPNPVKDNLSITSNSPSRVEIINSQGQIVYSGFIKSHHVIDVSGLPKGLYILRQPDNQKISSKFIKE